MFCDLGPAHPSLETRKPGAPGQIVMVSPSPGMIPLSAWKTEPQAPPLPGLGEGRPRPGAAGLQCTVPQGQGLDWVFSISVPLPANSCIPRIWGEMLIFMDGWEPGLLFTESHHQTTALFSKLIPEVQSVLPIKGSGRHEAGWNCQWEQRLCFRTGIDEESGSPSRIRKRSGQKGWRSERRDLIHDQIMAEGGGYNRCYV